MGKSKVGSELSTNANPEEATSERVGENDRALTRRSALLGGAATAALGVMALGPKGPEEAAATTPGPYNTSTLYPEDYGAYGDGIHDDTDAIQACIDDIQNLPRGSGTVQFGAKVYLVTKAPRTDRGGNAVLALPPGGFGWVRLAGVWGATVIRATQTGLNVSGGKGSPSVIGGPTPENHVDGQGHPVFSSEEFQIVDIRISVPSAPSISGIDLSLVHNCRVENVIIEAEQTAQGEFVDPRPNWWSFGLRMPGPLNYGKIRVDHVDVYGFYVGILCYSAHTHIGMAIVKWCFLGVGLMGSNLAGYPGSPMRPNDPHGTVIEHLSTEWCTIHIAGWRSWGSGPGANWLEQNYPYFLTMFHWDIEDAPGSPWYGTYVHISDGYDMIHGSANYLRVKAGAIGTAATPPNGWPTVGLLKGGTVANLTTTSISHHP